MIMDGLQKSRACHLPSEPYLVNSCIIFQSYLANQHQTCEARTAVRRNDNGQGSENSIDLFVFLHRRQPSRVNSCDKMKS